MGTLNINMKAAVLYELNTPLIVEDLTVPNLGYGQVLVKVAASGVCHTQLLEIQGKRGVDRYLPHTLGHEGSGVVDAVGPGVTRISVGEHVILSWIKGPGINIPSVTYYKGNQPINAGALTTFNEYTLASENRVTLISKEMPLDKAALIGCAVATGAGVIINTAKVEPGSVVVVFGAGGIGLNAIQAAAMMSATKIIAVDIHEHKLTQARVFGATHTINARDDDVVRKIKELTNGNGADYAIEAVGFQQTMEQAFLSIRAEGGLAILIGNPPHGTEISIDPFGFIRGKRLIGTWGGETNPEKDFPRYVNLYLAGKLKLDELITHRFQLEDINSALNALEKGEVARAIIEF